MCLPPRLLSTSYEPGNWRAIMPTRAEILDTLAASQTQVLTFFQGLSPEDLQRPATASDVPEGAPWCAKDHLAHLVKKRAQHPGIAAPCTRWRDARRSPTS